MEHKIRRIDVDPETNDCTFFFEGINQPFNYREFKPGTLTRSHLESINYWILDYNTEVELVRDGT